MKYTRDDLVKNIQDLGVTAMELYDELARAPDASTTRRGKTPALARLMNVYQRDLRTKLTELKEGTANAVKRAKEEKEKTNVN